jgi:hypothetical protein
MTARAKTVSRSPRRGLARAWSSSPSGSASKRAHAEVESHGVVRRRGERVGDEPRAHRSRRRLDGRGRGDARTRLRVLEPRDPQLLRSDLHADPSRRRRAAQRAAEHGPAVDRDLGCRARERDPDREPRADGELDRVPEAFAVVELPGRHPVEDGRVLDRVRVAVLVRAHEERLEALLVEDAPGDPGERATRRHRQLDLERPVLEREIADGDERRALVRAQPHAAPAEMLGRLVPGLAEVPALRAGFDVHVSRRARARARSARCRPHRRC